MNKHPKSSNILKVIQNFEKVLPMATKENHLNMMAVDVNRFTQCGTIHCHGGWYAIAACNVLNDLGFSAGANKMATDLGFTRNEDIEEWANACPVLWGNARGLAMFCNEEAFASPSRPEGAKTLQDIVNHWREVYERVKALEGAAQDDTWGKTIEPTHDPILDKPFPADHSPRPDITRSLVKDSVQERLDLVGVKEQVKL